MKKTFSQLEKGDLFTLAPGSDKTYRLIARMSRYDMETALDKTYYLTERAGGKGKSGFWSTNGDKLVYTTD